MTLFSSAMIASASSELPIARSASAWHRRASVRNCQSVASPASSRLAARDQDASPFERQLPIEVRRPALEQVVDLGPEPAGDNPQHPRRRLAATHLDLVQERSAEVIATDLRQTESPLLPQPADALSESFLPGHAGSLRDVKSGFTGLANGVRRERARGAAVDPGRRCDRRGEGTHHAVARPSPPCWSAAS